MNLLDLAILLILVAGTLAGFRQGFIVEAAGIFGALVAFAVAKQGYGTVRTFLASAAPHSPWLTIVSYLAVFLVVWGAILVGARYLRRSMRTFRLGALDGLGGGIIGLFQATLVLELLLYLCQRMPNEQVTSAVAGSTLAPAFLHLYPVIQQYFPAIPLS